MWEEKAMEKQTINLKDVQQSGQISQSERTLLEWNAVNFFVPGKK